MKGGEHGKLPAEGEGYMDGKLYLIAKVMLRFMEKVGR